MFRYLINLYKLFTFKRFWRSQNSHNQTTISKIVNTNRISVGKNTYGRINVSVFDHSNSKLLSIGSFCSIASNVHFLCGGDHYQDRILNYPIEKKLFDQEEALSKGEIIVGDDVWVGTNALILSGVKIGKGAIVAAGSVVTKDVPPYSIVGGVPAKIIKYRFSDRYIEKLKNLDFTKLDDDFIKENVELFNRPLDEEILLKFEDKLKYDL
ncbi:CatB-related O-acetyltransferase [Streptococcus parauberis]|uniref:CatB-related O-acetyltransferase n=1 Tax=Streptococcus parauberis TaxID=1348 RepID=UPI00020CBF5C|nr:CatB-related O-acetyltransferase [Streptococcus parauberis]AEF25343.1 putative acetyl transferase [Streptococcus parauberis KCTC 11537]UWM91923.1 CatB-related O-acetyltransferase [Streptococcus parauberis]WEM63885.1 CatB-related O-acetyltransferase [Streptococcus parauberis]GAJ62103.1 acetyl transferase [Streptococcus parauberis]